MSDLLQINVNDHTEKKNGLTYLSWAWAWAEVLKIDPQATWEAHEYNGLPCIVMPDTSCMVKVSVTIKGHTKASLLPVMNHRNQAIKGPDAFAINTAIVRCLTKAISMHGLGLYIYAGEDLPEQAAKDDPVRDLKSLPDGGKPLSGAGEKLDADERLFIDETAQALTQEAQAHPAVAYVTYTELKASLGEDQFKYLWSVLPSFVKTAIKKQGEAGKAHKEAA